MSAGRAASARTEAGRPVDARGLGVAAGLAALCVLALAPLAPVFDGVDFWIAAVGGVLLGTAIAWLAAVRGWGALVVAALVVGAYFVFGGVVAARDRTWFGVVPTLDTLADLALGVVFAWKRVLTVATPITGFDGLLVVPFIAGLLTSVVAVSIGLRARRPRWAVAPIALLLAGSICLSTFGAFLPAVIGAAFAAGAIAWAAWRDRDARAENLAQTSAARRTPRATAIAAGSLAVALAAGLTAGAVVPATDRVVLRDLIVPPLEVHDFASPLTSFRKYMTDGEASVLFTVDGLPAGARIRLATLDQYDGIVYRVSGDGSAGGGTFARVGREIATDAPGEPASLTITVGDLRGVWLPDVGAATALRLADAGSRADDLNYNAATGTAVLTSGLVEGDAYAVDAVVPTAPDEADLVGAEVDRVTLSEPQDVPEAVSAFTADVTAGTSSAFEQLSAIASTLHDDGFYSNGLEGQVASRSGHRAERIAALLEGTQMIGDEEQYAVAMALAAAQLGLPARVVMGFRPEADPAAGAGGGSVAVTAADATVWVEVPFRGIGWVPFDPTPPKDQVPQQEVPEPEQKPQAQVLQPPPQPDQPVELPPDPPADEAEHREQPLDLAWLWVTLRWVGIGLGIVLLLLGPALVMAGAKAVRRRRRAGAPEPSDRMSGGWAELRDTALDHGAVAPDGATRREQVAVLEERFADASPGGSPYGELASRADVAVFGAGDPSAEEVAAYWNDVRTATRGIGRAAGWRARLRGFLLPRSVLRDLGAGVKPRRLGAAGGASGGASEGGDA
ncbi:transglutaminaseTgpA domain-containing protein [Agromyces sp. MMS24-K17]|uniref:transglutaminaseTgpA domain-containing protein n=1 Tax=Agromyces sp. MMS24-K17 TaxID=3372850 RepID=UPI003754CF36